MHARLSFGTGHCACLGLVALVAGCCAVQPVAHEPSVGGPSSTASAGERPEQPGQLATDVEFTVIDADEARRRLWPEPGPSAYLAPDSATATALARLIRGLLADPRQPDSELLLAAREAGFVVEGWTIDGRRYLAAIERPDRRGGGGAYVVRADPPPTSATSLTAPPTPVILQAPHGFYDLGTERIALDLLLSEQGWPRALFVNTVHRYLGADGVKKKQQAHPADPCHSDQHLLAVATAAALDALPNAEFVQLHGFGDGDDTITGPRAAAIVSGGRPDAPTPRARIVAARMRETLGVEVALFPVDTDRLGATTNVQGRAIRARGTGDFVHIEMSSALRQQLRRDPTARAGLAAALRADAPALTHGTDAPAPSRAATPAPSLTHGEDSPAPRRDDSRAPRRTDPGTP